MLQISDEKVNSNNIVFNDKLTTVTYRYGENLLWYIFTLAVPVY